MTAHRDHKDRKNQIKGQLSNDELGNLIRQARLTRGWKQTALGAEVGMAPSSIANLEGGWYSPSIHQIMGLARALGMSIDDLVGVNRDKDDLTPIRERAELLGVQAESLAADLSRVLKELDGLINDLRIAR